MIAASTTLSANMMVALLTTLGSAATVTLYPGTRPAPGATAVAAPVAVCVLATPAGVVDVHGELVLSASADGQLTGSATPTWARIIGTGGAWVLDCDARLSAEADTGQEIVVAAPAMYAGAFVRIASGTFSARP